MLQTCNLMIRPIPLFSAMRKANWTRYRTWVDYFSPDGLPPDLPVNNEGEVELPEREYNVEEEDERFNIEREDDKA